jgi:hypothetical protein
MLRFAVALTHFNQYVVGFEGLSKYLVALSLDKMLIQTGLRFPKFQKENLRDLKTYDIVRFLERENHINPETARKLREYVDFSQLMLTTSVVSEEESNSKGEEILRFLCSQAGIDFDQEVENRAFDDIATLRTKQALAVDNYKITTLDFDNFDKLFVKCPALQSEIEKRLKVSLRREQISGFTPSTGGIWLPFVIRKAPGKRTHIRRASVGVTFTPIDIRIGLDFGDLAHKERIKYYDLLLNGELNGEFEILNRKDTGYCFCDTFWRFHIRNIVSLQWCFGLYSYEKEAIRKDIEETKQLAGEPLTSNKHLISKVISRRPDDFASVIDRIVEETSKTLDELYPIIERIETS